MIYARGCCCRSLDSFAVNTLFVHLISYRWPSYGMELYGTNTCDPSGWSTNWPGG